MDKILVCITIGFLFWSCNNPENTNNRNLTSNVIVNEKITSKLINLFWGGEDNAKLDTTNPLETSMYFLNKSLFNKAYYTLKNSYTLDSVFTGGFYGFKSSNNYDSNKYKLYAFYRLNDYGENITGNTLSSELLRSLVDSMQSIYALQDLEYSYLNVKYNSSIEDAKLLISKLLALKRSMPNALRLDYLLIFQYFIIDDTLNAIRLSDKLINNDYYALPILRSVIKHLLLKNSTSVKKYLELFDKKFPNECNIARVNQLSSNKNEVSILYECKKCYESSFQMDSINARLALVRYYINNRKLSEVENLVKEYFNNIDKEPYDEERLYVKGSYYDFYLRALFLQGKYKKIREFIEKKVQYNPVVKLNDENDFKLYIKKMYLEYVSLDYKNFNSFFKNKFGE